MFVTLFWFIAGYQLTFAADHQGTDEKTLLHENYKLHLKNIVKSKRANTGMILKTQIFH
jgi:hypothetical protein